MPWIMILPLPFFSICNPSAKKSVRQRATPKNEVNTQTEVNTLAKNVTEFFSAIVLNVLTRPLVELVELRIVVKLCSP